MHPRTLARGVSTEPAPARLVLGDGWTETTFDRGAYGPDDRDGLVAAFERDAMRASVVPVRYECADGEERLRGLTTDLERSRRERTTFLPDVRPRTAFATQLEYQPYASAESSVVCVAADAGDALAVATWLTDATTHRDLQRAVQAHRGDPAAAGTGISDDDALAALFADEPTRCPFTGSPTSSHEIDLPYRYYPALENARRTPSGRPRFPGTVATLAAAVSHTAWTEHDLGALEFGAPVERAEPGVYELDGAVASAMADADAGAFTLRQLDVQSR